MPDVLGGTDSVLSLEPQSITPARGELRDFGDPAHARRLIYRNVLNEARKLPPLSNKVHTLELDGVDYEDPEDISLKDQKNAILTGKTLHRRLRGTFKLKDNLTGDTLDEKHLTIAQVPHMTERGVFIINGSEYGLSSQLRLRPGIFTRIKENGEVDSHVNVNPGQGLSHHLLLDPETGVFRINVGQAKVPLAPLLKAMGVTDNGLRQAWGNDLFAANAKYADEKAIDKLYGKLARNRVGDVTHEDRSKALSEIFQAMKLDPEVTKRTLRQPFANVSPESMLATTQKLLAVHRGEEEPDDRDHMAYQTLHGPEDLFAERVRNAGRVMRPLLWRTTLNKNLSRLQPGFLTKHLAAAITGSGLGGNLEEVNPAELLDQMTRVSRLGVGGIPSTESIPEESRNVHTSQFGYIDPVRTPESSRIGVDTRLASATRKGEDGKLYTQFRDPRTGGMDWLSPQEIADKKLAFPGELSSGRKHVRAIVDGKMRFIRRRDADYSLPEMEHGFNQLANMIPFKSDSKAQRVAMGSRMLAQALPVLNPEAPLVQSGIPGEEDASYEAKYGRHMGAVHADQDGVVVGVAPEGIKVKYADGSVKTHETYENFPMNRKTQLHNTPVVQVGQPIRSGDLLAKSNFTDDKGTTALGLNLRTAYGVFQGANFEDAKVISESAAKRLTSAHMYQHDTEYDEHVRRGKKAFVSIFPGAVDRKTLETMDDDGVIHPGSVVNPGDPLVLMARERERSHNQISRGKDSSFKNGTLTWEHHVPGVVTDVAKTKNGVVVTVKSIHESKVGDKLSDRFGGKGIIAKIVPDHEMPHDAQGQPFEVMENPLGVITRTNASQIAETVLGKIAARTGIPYKVKDFQNGHDMVKFAMDELAKHGMTDTETITDPTAERNIPNILTGNRFYMKLHHTSECFDDQTEALTDRGWVPWPEVKETDRLATEEDGKLLFERPLKLVSFPFLGNLQCFSGRYVDYAVTENHHLYLNYPYDKRFRLVEAATARGRRFGVKQFGIPVRDFDKATTIRIGDHDISWADYAEIVGWWASKGYAKATHRTAYVVIYQSKEANPDHFSDIESLAGRLPFAWCYYRSKGKYPGIIISSRALAENLRSFGTYSHNKRLPRILLEQSPEIMRIAFEAMMSGDGSRMETPTGPSWRYTTVSKGLADDFQELCIRMGLGAVVRKPAFRPHTVFTLPDGRKYISRNRQAWECGVAIKRTVAQVDGDRNKQSFSVRPYEGVVYCAEMRTGLLYVRRDGKPMLSGNSKSQGRSTGSYSADESPSKGGESDSSKRVSLMDLHAILSHGALSMMPNLIRGQKNLDWWAAYMGGQHPPDAKIPQVHKKFYDLLRAGGINPVRTGAQTQIMAMTNKDVDHLSEGREIRNAETVEWKEGMKPIPGGLMDPALTGGHAGNRWSHISLAEPMVNPVMEDPARKLLGLTEKGFEEVLSGKKELGGSTGPQALASALKRIDLDKEITQARQEVDSTKKTARDSAIKRLALLKHAKMLGIHPGDWVLDKAPVLPPIFRPVSVMAGSKQPMVADANYLYKELFEANDNLKHMGSQVSDVGEERLALYKAFKAVTGLGDPITPKNQERGVKGVLQAVFGSSPKYGLVQRKILGSNVDLVGRAAISPNPDLDMDEIGIPEEKAWEIYKPFVIRGLVQHGVAPMQAAELVKNRDPLAAKKLHEVLQERPVVATRAPVLHRYGVMAFWPKLVKEDTLQLPPLVVKGFGADFDGDAMNYHVPVSDEEVHDATSRMLPSRNLLSTKDFRAHILPMNEYVGGLYHGTSQTAHDKPEHVFHTKADAVRAFRQGRINSDTRIVVLEP